MEPIPSSPFSSTSSLSPWDRIQQAWSKTAQEQSNKPLGERIKQTALTPYYQIQGVARWGLKLLELGNQLRPPVLLERASQEFSAYLKDPQQYQENQQAKRHQLLEQIGQTLQHPLDRAIDHGTDRLVHFLESSYPEQCRQMGELAPDIALHFVTSGSPMILQVAKQTRSLEKSLTALTRLEQKTVQQSVGSVEKNLVRSGEHYFTPALDEWKKARAYLLAHEKQGGHFLQKHVGKDEQFLRDRMTKEGILEASTFFDEKTAARVLQDTIRKNQNKIKDWLKNPYAGDLYLDYRGGGKPIGFSVRSGNNQIYFKNEARVILQQDRKGGYYILTGYVR